MDSVKKSKVRIGFVLFLLAFVNYSYFFHRSPGWNVNSRLALTYAIVDEGILKIDRYHEEGAVATGDKAFFEGHYYSDKMIGVSLLGVIPYGLSRVFLGKDVALRFPHYARYITRVFSVSLCGALAVVVMYHILLLFGSDIGTAAFLALLFAFGTMFFPYSTVFFPYAPAVLLSLLAFRSILKLKPESHTFSDFFLIGLFLGLTLLFEYIFGLVVAALLVYLIALKKPRPDEILLCGAGIFAGLIPFFIYSVAIFGTITIPYSHEADPLFREGMSRGFMGITAPRLTVLYYLTIHPYRGLFFLSPFLLFSLLGGVVWLAQKKFVPETILCLSLIVLYLLFNSAYYMWWGGWTAVPRHLIPMIPFMIPLLIPILKSKRLVRYLLYIGIFLGVFFSIIIAATDPQEPQGYQTVFLLNPRISYNFQSRVLFRQAPDFIRGDIDPNIGSFIGLRGLTTLLPLLLISVVLIIWIRIKVIEKERAPVERQH